MKWVLWNCPQESYSFVQAMVSHVKKARPEDIYDNIEVRASSSMFPASDADTCLQCSIGRIGAKNLLWLFLPVRELWKDLGQPLDRMACIYSPKPSEKLHCGRLVMLVYACDAKEQLETRSTEVFHACTRYNFCENSPLSAAGCRILKTPLVQGE